jgi:tetratricopeptide (TPR) repeat protein
VHFPKVSKADYDYALDMAREILAIPEKNGIVLTDTDNVVFPCMYLQIVDKVRPDLRVISPTSIYARGWHGKDLVLRIAPTYTPPPGATNFEQIVEKNFADTPVYSTASNIVHSTWQQIWLGFAIRIVPETPPVDEPIRAISSLGFSAAKYPDIDSDAREAIRMPQALRANVEYGKKNYQAVSDIDLRITTFFQTDLYVPLLYSCATYSGIYEFWGRALYPLAKYQEIVDHLPQATIIDDKFVSLELARAYWQLGQYESALTELDKYLLRAPASVEALTDKGQILTVAGELDDSVEVLRTAVELGPQDQRARYSYGFALFKAGQKAAANQQLEAAVNIDPNSDFAAQAQTILEQIQK